MCVQDSQHLLSTNGLQGVPSLHCTDFSLSIRARNLRQLHITKISSVLSLMLATLPSYVFKLLLEKVKRWKIIQDTFH